MRNQPLTFYSEPLPGIDTSALTGQLFVFEGAARAGCSTQIGRLKPWLESQGHAVICSRPGQSRLAAKGMRRAGKTGLLHPCPRILLDAADLADRLEKDILPALRAGFIVLAERYSFSLIAEAVAEGENRKWAEKLAGFALAPNATFYLQASLPELVRRLASTGEWFDYDRFAGKQARIIRQLDGMAEKNDFSIIQAALPEDAIASELQARMPVTGAAPLRPSLGRTRRSLSRPRSA